MKAFRSTSFKVVFITLFILPSAGCSKNGETPWAFNLTNASKTKAVVFATNLSRDELNPSNPVFELIPSGAAPLTSFFPGDSILVNARFLTDEKFFTSGGPEAWMDIDYDSAFVTNTTSGHFRAFPPPNKWWGLNVTYTGSDAATLFLEYYKNGNLVSYAIHNLKPMELPTGGIMAYYEVESTKNWINAKLVKKWRENGVDKTKDYLLFQTAPQPNGVFLSTQPNTISMQIF